MRGPAKDPAASREDARWQRRRRTPRPSRLRWLARVPGVRGPLARRVRRSLRPPRTLRPTRAGWLFFALTFGVGFAALNTGNNLLYLVLSFMLAFLVLSGVFSESALRGVQVRRRVPREIFAGRAAPVALEIHNTLGRVPAFALVVEDLGPGRLPAGRTFALRVDPQRSELRTYGLVVAERGTFPLWGFRVSTRFPFGLFSKAMLIESPETLLVYPGIDPAAVAPPRRADLRAGEAPSLGRGHGTEVAGLREYAAGDAHRRVHWRASLRRGELLVRDTESERNARVEVRLVRRTPGAEAFEAAVRRAASQVVAFLDAGLRVGLETEDDRLPADAGPHHRARLLGYLARVQPLADAPAPGAGESAA